MSDDKKIKYAIVGLGFISGRHITAIEDTGGELILACDIDESKKHKAGDAKFFTDYSNMLRDKLFDDVDYVVICTPNYLHYQMTMSACLSNKKVIVEKPTVINKEELKDLYEYKDKISCILQLRKNPTLIELKKLINKDERYSVSFEVCVHRDDWYFESWKNDKEKSGGLAFNIGAHYFDLLTWFFGSAKGCNMTETKKGDKINGLIKFKNCLADFNLSISQPMDNQYRYFKINGEEIDLTKNFEGLHTRVYEDILKGKSITLKDVLPSIKLISKLYGS